MADLVPLDDLFTITYGNQLDRNKLTSSDSGINFVTRSSGNLGVDGKVAVVDGAKIFPAGSITATMGGTYLLSAFIQPERFYTGQNIKVLIPKAEMTFNEKAFYCLAIARNRSRYTSHGREANKTFDQIKVPAKHTLPEWVNEAGVQEPPISSSNDKVALTNVDGWGSFTLAELFVIERGKGPRKSELNGTGDVPFITSIDGNNGLTGFVEGPARHEGNVLTVNRNGSVGEAFYQPSAFSTTEDVHVFVPKFEINAKRGLFISALIRRERYRFGYGRKWGLDRMKTSTIRLPLAAPGMPDWKWIDSFMSSLPYGKGV